MNRRRNQLINLIVAAVGLFLNDWHCTIDAFVLAPYGRASQTIFYVSKINESPPTEAQSGDDDDDMDDETILKQTPKDQLVELCQQFGLSIKGSKTEMLQRLRDYAQEQAEKEKERLLKRRKTVEEGTGDEREKFEIIDDSIDEEEEEEFYFYYESKVPDEKEKTKEKKKTTSEEATSSQGVVTAPPPPDIKPNEDGERVVTVYSTTDQNDLTGVAASQPGQAASFDPLTSTTSEPIDAPWETNNPRKSKSCSLSKP